MRRADFARKSDAASACAVISETLPGQRQRLKAARGFGEIYARRTRRSNERETLAREQLNAALLLPEQAPAARRRAWGLFA